MALKTLEAKSYNDWSKGCFQSASESVAPENSAKLNLNLNSDDEIGNLVSRYGTTLINAQIVDNKPILGLHNFRDSVGSGSKLFAAVSDGVNTDIYDVLTGSKSLQDDTKDLKTRFLTYLDACVRLNGTDAAKYWNGTSWHSSSTGAAFTAAVDDIITSNSHGLLDGDIVTLTTTGTLPDGLALTTNYYVRDKTVDTFKVSLTSGGSAVDITGTGTGTHSWWHWNPFDIANFPSGAKSAIEFRDKIYAIGFTNNPDRMDISGIANSTTRKVSWTVGNTFIIFEQEDGGGGLIGIAKIPGYVLAFKKRTLKRWDGSSAYPEDMVNQGVASQEAIVVAQGICFFANENGIWTTEGGRPQKISTYTVDKIVKSCSAANLLNVASGTDEEHVFWSFASVTMNGETYSNIVLKYNILQNTWDIRQYPTLHRVYAKYVDSNNSVFLVTGDDDGSVLKMDTGATDNATAITYALETQDLTFGFRSLLKSISQIGFVTDDISNGTVAWRTTNDPEDWVTLGTIDQEVKAFNQDLRGVKYNFKIYGTTSSGQVKIKSIEFLEGIQVYDSSN